MIISIQYSELLMVLVKGHLFKEKSQFSILIANQHGSSRPQLQELHLAEFFPHF